jgi:hypothetical protein
MARDLLIILIAGLLIFEVGCSSISVQTQTNVNAPAQYTVLQSTPQCLLRDISHSNIPPILIKIYSW